MNSFETILQQAVQSFRPSKALCERMKARVRPLRSNVTVVFISENSQRILESVFKYNSKLLKKIKRQ